jgi:hypothetical protein
VEALKVEQDRAETRLEAVQRRRLIGTDAEDVRRDIDELEALILELEPSVVEHQRASARREHLRGEIAAHRDFQAALDSAEGSLRTVVLERERTERLITLLERLRRDAARP